jgi:hypothetical protein
MTDLWQRELLGDDFVVVLILQNLMQSIMLNTICKLDSLIVCY